MSAAADSGLVDSISCGSWGSGVFRTRGTRTREPHPAGARIQFSAVGQGQVRGAISSPHLNQKFKSRAGRRLPANIQVAQPTARDSCPRTDHMIKNVESWRYGQIGGRRSSSRKLTQIVLNMAPVVVSRRTANCRSRNLCVITRRPTDTRATHMMSVGTMSNSKLMISDDVSSAHR